MIRKPTVYLTVILLSCCVQAVNAQWMENYVDSLQQRLLEVEDTLHQISILYDISATYYYHEKYEQSKPFAYRALGLAQNTQVDGSTSENILRLLANLCYEQDVQDSLDLLLPQIFELCTASNNTDCLIEYYNTRAVLFDLSTFPDSSLYYYNKALDLAKGVPTWEDLILNNIGVIFSTMELNQKARSFYRRARKKAIEGDDIYVEGLALLNIGYTFIREEKLDSADWYLTVAHQAALESEYIELLADVLAYQGLSELRKGQLELADSLIHQSYDYYSELGLKRQMGEMLPYLAELYLSQGKLEKSRENALLSIQINRNNQSNIYLLEAFSILAQSYRRVQDYQQADFYEKAYNNLQDTVQRYILRNQFSMLEMDYQIAAAEAEILQVQKEQAQALRMRTLALIGVIGLAVLLAIIISLLFQQSRRRRRQNIWLESEVQARTAELNQSNDDLKNYVEEMRSFTHITSHDLKEPLRNISSFTSLLERRLKGQLEGEGLDFMDHIKANAHQMHRLIEGILFYSTLDHKEKHAPDPEEVDLSQIIESIKHALATTIQEKQAEVICITKLPRIISSPEALHVILKNLIENGIKYNRSCQPTVEVSYTSSSSHYYIHIKDNGIGIEPQYQEQIFQMFKRLHNQEEFKGTGMGLAICRKLLRRLGGDIHLQSNLNEGSIFTVILPKTEVNPPLSSVIQKGSLLVNF